MDVEHSTLTGIELHKAKIDTGSASPFGSTPAFEGQVFAQATSDRATLWGAISGAWVAIAGKPIFGDYSPAGSVTPDYRGQFYYSIVTDMFYLAIGPTSSDWVLVATTSPAVGSGES